MLIDVLKAKDLRKHKFPLITVEITGLSISKLYAIACKYFNNETKSITTKVLDLTEIYNRIDSCGSAWEKNIPASHKISD